MYPNGLDTTVLLRIRDVDELRLPNCRRRCRTWRIGRVGECPDQWAFPPNTTYDYQLVASSAFRTSYGGSQTVTTGGSVSTSISLAAPMAGAPAALTLSASVLPANATGTVEFVNGSTPSRRLQCGARE